MNCNEVLQKIMNIQCVIVEIVLLIWVLIVIHMIQIIFVLKNKIIY